jgi:hypothetical protein
VAEHLGEIARPEDPDSRSEGRLLTVELGKQHLAAAGLPRGQRERESPVDRTQPAVERQLSHQSLLLEGFRLEGALRGEDPHGDGKVQASTALAQPSGGEVDCDTAFREAFACGGDRRSYAGHTLPHDGFGKSHEVDARQQGADAHLHLDGDPLDPVQRRADHAGHRLLQGTVVERRRG